MVRIQLEIDHGYAHFIFMWEGHSEWNCWLQVPFVHMKKKIKAPIHVYGEELETSRI